MAARGWGEVGGGVEGGGGGGPAGQCLFSLYIEKKKKSFCQKLLDRIQYYLAETFFGDPLPRLFKLS